MVAKKTVHSVLSGRFDEDMLNGLSSFIDSRKNSLRLIISFEKWIIPLVELGIPFSAAFHAHPSMSDEERRNWFTISGHDAESKQRADKAKIDFAKKSGYNVEIIWDRDVKLKHDRDAKIEQTVMVLNENKENLK